MKKLPIGLQTFSKIVNGDCLYVDKTEDIVIVHLLQIFTNDSPFEKGG